jgi:hypothetical protein
MNTLVINRGKSGLGRAPLGSDYISGMVFYTGSAPAGFSPTNILKFSSIQDAINAGILNNYNDETANQVSYTITHIGQAGDNVVINVQENVNLVQLMNYTFTGSESTPTLLAAAFAAAINLNTKNTGYTATSSVGVVTIIARPGLGVFLNTGTPYSATVTLTGSSPYTSSGFLQGSSATTAGVASLQAQWYYHINRYFTQAPNTTLWVGMFAIPSWSGYAYGEISLMQNASGGTIRQLGMYLDGQSYATMATLKATVQACQAQAALMITAYTPLSVFIAPDLHAVSNMATFTDRSGDNSEHVSVIIGQDGGALGANLYASYGKSITQLGDILGITASAQVSDDIAWLGGGYNLAVDTVENAIAAFSNGKLLSANTSYIVTLDTYRYLFGLNYQGVTGTGVNDSHTCTLYSSDYAYIENNRTIDKASRLLYSAYVTQLASPLQVNADGTLVASLVASLEGVGEDALSSMVSNNPNSGRPELSGVDVTINPAQNVVTTSTLAVSIALLPIGSARKTVFNLAFVTSL